MPGTIGGDADVSSDGRRADFAGSSRKGASTGRARDTPLVLVSKRALHGYLHQE